MAHPFLPNSADATISDQAEPDSVDFDTLVGAHALTGVVSGCVVSEDPTTPDMTVDVAAGEVRIAGKPVTVSAQANNAITAADGSNLRIDLVSINSSGTVVVTDGTPAANAVAPAIPATSVPLAFVYVPASDTTITDNQIVDKRITIPAASVLEVTTTTVLTATSPPIINAETSGGTYTVDLPDNAAAIGRAFTIRREGATNWVQLDAVGTDTFSDGTGIHRLDFDGEEFMVYSVGDGVWKIANTMIHIERDPNGVPLVKIEPEGDAGDGASTGGAVLIENTASGAPALNVYSNQTTQGSNDPLVRIQAANSSFGEGALEVVNEGTAGGAFNIKLLGASPQIEFVESDQTSPDGKFEIQVQSNTFKITSRDVGDVAFENMWIVDQLKDGGRFELQDPAYIAIDTAGPQLDSTGLTKTPLVGDSATTERVEFGSNDVVIYDGANAKRIEVLDGGDLVLYDEDGTTARLTINEMYNQVEINNVLAFAPWTSTDVANIQTAGQDTIQFIITETGVSSRTWLQVYGPAHASAGDIVLRSPSDTAVILTWDESDDRLELSKNIDMQGNTIRDVNRAVEYASSPTLDWDDHIVSINSAASTRAVTLPSCATYNGHAFFIQRDGGNNVTIDPGTDTFSDTGTSTDKTLGSDGAAIGLYSVGGTEWKVAGTEGTVT